MINTDSLFYKAFGTASREDYVVLISYGILGLLISMLIELIRNKNKIKSQGGFKLTYWFYDNFARILLSIIAIFVGIQFSPELLNLKISNWGALVAGISTDKIIETLVSLKSSSKNDNSGASSTN